MNKITLMGRLTADPEVRYTFGEHKAVARYSLAVDRYKKKDEETSADFFRIVAFDSKGEFAEKYLRKGMKVLVTGHVQTGTYENHDGIKVPFFDVVAEDQEFCESRNTGDSSSYGRGWDNAKVNSDGIDGFVRIDDDVDDLPFDTGEAV